MRCLDRYTKQEGKMMSPDKEPECLKLIKENIMLSKKNDSFRMIHGLEYVD